MPYPPKNFAPAAQIKGFSKRVIRGKDPLARRRRRFFLGFYTDFCSKMMVFLSQITRKPQNFRRLRRAFSLKGGSLVLQKAGKKFFFPLRLQSSFSELRDRIILRNDAFERYFVQLSEKSKILRIAPREHIFLIEERALAKYC